MLVVIRAIVPMAAMASEAIFMANFRKSFVSNIQPVFYRTNKHTTCQSLSIYLNSLLQNHLRTQ